VDSVSPLLDPARAAPARALRRVLDWSDGANADGVADSRVGGSIRASREDVLLIEPCHERLGHASFNRAFLATVREALPAARITFACATGYRQDLAGGRTGRAIGASWMDAPAWPHPNFSPTECWRRFRWLARLVRRAREAGRDPSHVVVLGSSGPLLLAVFAIKVLFLRKGCRVLTVLHGNANEIVHGWQPRNVVLKAFSFRSAMRLLRVFDVQAIALEAWIAEKLREAFPAHATSIGCIPHAVDEGERLPAPARPGSGSALTVLFLGQATPYKGFEEFVRLAGLARRQEGFCGEFRAVGSVRPDVRHVDQSPLARRAAEAGVPRAELLAEAANADFVFMWQNGHYELSPSGVLLDCISLGIPMVGCRSVAIDEIERRHGPVGMFAEDPESLLVRLIGLKADPALRQRLVSEWKTNLEKARLERLPRSLGSVARRQLLA